MKTNIHLMASHFSWLAKVLATVLLMPAFAFAAPITLMGTVRDFNAYGTTAAGVKNEGVIMKQGVGFTRLVLLAVFICFFGLPSLSSADEPSKLPPLLDPPVFLPLPTFPILDPADPIPDDLIAHWGSSKVAYKCVASKGYAEFPAKDHNSSVDQTPPDYSKSPPDDAHCDDEDSTLFNGLLCAVGVEEGCEAVKESQIKSGDSLIRRLGCFFGSKTSCFELANAKESLGQWYRSPFRRWISGGDVLHPSAELNCALQSKKTIPDKDFCGKCAHTLSPDQALSVSLYGIKKGDTAAIQNWLNWIELHADDNKIVTSGGEHQFTWPHFGVFDTNEQGCDADDANIKLGPVKIGTDRTLLRTTSMRPQDSWDYHAVVSKLGIAVGPNLAKAINIGEATEPFPAVVAGSALERDFSLHLEAVRVLLRMLVLNPSLQWNNISNLSPIPLTEDSILGVIQNPSLDITAIHEWAGIIYRTDPWNPFYQLLYEGPNESVRQKILNICPKDGEETDQSQWLWERQALGDPNDPKYSADYRKHSMGWDCVFIGTLFNKMRVEDPNLLALIDLFIKSVDPVTLRTLQGATDLTISTLKEAQAELKHLEEMNDWLSNQAKTLVAAQYQIVNNAYNAINSAQQAIQNQQGVLASNVCATQGPITTICDNVCNRCPPYDPVCRVACPRVCHASVNQAYAPCTAAINAISAQIGLVTATNGQISSAKDRIRELTATASDYSTKLADGALESGKSKVADLQLKAEQAKALLDQAMNRKKKIDPLLKVWKG